MAVRVDQAGDHGPAAAVEPIARPFRAAVAALQQLADPPVVADPHAVEADEPPVLAQRIAVDIVDQRVGERGRGEEQGGGREERKTFEMIAMATAIGPVRAPRQMV